MTPEAKVLLDEKIEQLKVFKDDSQIAVNARDLRAFGMQVPETIPPGNPVFLSVGELRNLAGIEPSESVIEDCGCPGKE